jgi:hypothetical protein
MTFKCVCLQCGTTFLAHRSTAKFCKDACRKKYARNKKKKKLKQVKRLAPKGIKEEMTKSDYIQQFKAAFKEQMLTKGYFGVKVGRKWVELFWKEELLPKIEWRIDAKSKNERVPKERS